MIAKLFAVAPRPRALTATNDFYRTIPRRFFASLASLALGAYACAALAGEQYAGSGFYIKNVTPSIGAPAYQSFVGLVQHQPNVTAMFIDYRDPIVNLV